jgi:hypothetical protein
MEIRFSLGNPCTRALWAWGSVENYKKSLDYSMVVPRAVCDVQDDLRKPCPPARAKVRFEIHSASVASIPI